jgi:hypothetical protein
VTFEDAMISGLLSTLNEEAQEDVLSEELDAMHHGSSGNLSINESLENLNKSMEGVAMSPNRAIRCQFKTPFRLEIFGTNFEPIIMDKILSKSYRQDLITQQKLAKFLNLKKLKSN